VNVKVAVPIDIPVIRPVALMVAIDGLLLTQVPPEAGLMFVVDPVHISLGPVKTNDGLPLINSGNVGLDVQPALDTKVNVTLP
jgi:hypothetical protein